MARIFTLKQKHFRQIEREGHGYCHNDPYPFLPSVVTGSGIYHSGFGSVVTLGTVPSGVSAYVYEDSQWATANYLAFVLETQRFFPVTFRWVSGVIEQSQYSGMPPSAYRAFVDFN